MCRTVVRIELKFCMAFGTVQYSVDVAITFIIRKSIVQILAMMIENKNTVMVNLIFESVCTFLSGIIISNPSFFIFEWE